MRRIITILVALVASLLMLHSVFALNPAELGAIVILSFVGILIFWFLIVFLAFAGVVFWLWMFIDCLVRDNFEGPNDKIVWVLVLLFASILGAFLYFLLVRRKLSKNGVKQRSKVVRKKRKRK